MMDFDFDLLASPLNFAASVNNFPENIKNQMPDSYPYIWAKCSLMIQLGFQQYAKNDYFPLPESVTTDFSGAVHQIVNDLTGFCPELPININDTITMHYIAYSLHYNIILITDFDDGIIQVDAKHLVEEDDEITLYFIQQKL